MSCTCQSDPSITCPHHPERYRERDALQIVWKLAVRALECNCEGNRVEILKMLRDKNYDVMADKLAETVITPP